MSSLRPAHLSRFVSSNPTEAPRDVENFASAFAFQNLEPNRPAYALVALQEKQRSLQNRLAAIQQQQMQESIGGSTRYSSSSAFPDSSQMIIYGIREELERVAAQILVLSSKSSGTD